ncbi:tetraspanin-33-like [Ornithodoros turicata]|uniref:tetraspanin-33-like n=1 Tax=Ornithodoros turicata TaxID=34597 RepID=UPI00313920A9
MEDRTNRSQSIDKEWRHGSWRQRSLSATVDEDVHRTTRVSLIVCNLLVMLISLVVLWGSVVAIWTRPPSQGGFWEHIHNNAIFAIAMHMELPFLVLSLFAFATASFGMLGALRENKKLLSIYNKCLLVAVLIVSACLVAYCLLPASLKRSVKDRYFSDFIVNYRRSPDFQKLVDGMQEHFRCCGISDENFRDWDLNPYFSCKDDNPSRERCNVPYSCCRRNDSQQLPLSTLCGAKMLAVSDEEAWERIYVRSCADAVVGAMHNSTGVVLMICVVINFVLLVLLTTSIHLRREIEVMSAIYNAYYDNLIQGQEKMKRDGVSLPPKKVDEKPKAQLFRKFWERIKEVFLKKDLEEENRSGESADKSNGRNAAVVVERCKV